MPGRPRCGGAPPALVRAIERAMAPLPADRFADADAARAAFEAALAALRADPHAARPRTAVAPAWLALAFIAALAAALAWARFAPRPHVAAPAPAAPAAYDVDATLLKLGARGAEPLVDGDRVAPGDRLLLEFRATRAAWVYVLDADDRGETFLLYPQPLFARTNPQPAGASVRLPGPVGNREEGWVVTSRGGREHLLIVAAPEPVAELEQARADIPPPRPDRPVEYAQVEPSALGRLRGIGGVAEVPAPPVRAGVAPLFARIRALAGREQGVRGVWVRQLTLENPVR